MKLQFLRAAAAALCAAVFLSGCVTMQQTPVAFGVNASNADQKPVRIGVAMTALPKVDTQLPGASCLLCIAAASAANSSLTSYAHTLPSDDVAKLKADMAELLRKKGFDAVVIPDPLVLKPLPNNSSKAPNTAKKDFSSLKAKLGVDKLLVIDISSLGFVRTYSAYIPTSAPLGTLAGTGYIVDLTSNTYDWYLPVNVTKSADGEWKEPPKYPGLTNAYFQAVETARDEFLKPFQLQ